MGKLLNMRKPAVYVAALCLCLMVNACSEDFLERPPIGQISDVSLNNKAGVEGLLVGAYSLLDGVGVPGVSDMHTGVWNAWLGSTASDDSRKGGGYGSQVERLEIENYTYTAFNDILAHTWRHYYGGIQRANEVLRTLARVDAGVFTDAEATQITAEARFLRGLYHLDAAKTWRNVPYVDESITFSEGNYNVSNTEPVWPKIEADLTFAMENLAPVASQPGRANSWAAMAFLVKAYMFQGKFNEAKPLLDNLIANGVTPGGDKYDLQPEFSQLWRPQWENGPEAVFSVQNSVNDGANGLNGNFGEWSNYPPFLNPSGWGNQPSFSLVNSYKTQDGLPLIETWNDFDITNDMGMDLNEPFTPYAGPLDPRLDWTVGRREIPYHDWQVYRQPWDVGGPYRGKKWVHWKADEAHSEVKDGWQAANGTNFAIIRFAEVLLWAAEVEVEIGSLAKAESYVNRVRNRAANPAGFLKKYNNPDDPSQGFSNVPAANYEVLPYSGQFEAKGKEFAREAVRFERKLELAMEGHRFFDLQRYDLQQPGYMASMLNDYIAHENATHLAATGEPYLILQNAKFVQGKHEIYAIPNIEIDRSRIGTEATLKQNPNH